jgi:hypothetical protein
VPQVIVVLQGSGSRSANCGKNCRLRFHSLRTGWLAVRPAITEVWRRSGLFVESDYPPPT